MRAIFFKGPTTWRWYSFSTFKHIMSCMIAIYQIFSPRRQPLISLIKYLKKPLNLTWGTKSSSSTWPLVELLDFQLPTLPPKAVEIKCFHMIFQLANAHKNIIFVKWCEWWYNNLMLAVRHRDGSFSFHAKAWCIASDVLCLCLFSTSLILSIHLFLVILRLCNLVLFCYILLYEVICGDFV